MTSISVPAREQIGPRPALATFCPKNTASLFPHFQNAVKMENFARYRFSKPAETRYAPIEGEALAWSLQQTKYFTQGWNNLLVVTDHKPLGKLFSDRMVDEISDSRLFSLRQRTLQCKFDIEYIPGKDNCFSDATSL